MRSSWKSVIMLEKKSARQQKLSLKRAKVVSKYFRIIASRNVVLPRIKPVVDLIGFNPTLAQTKFAIYSSYYLESIVNPDKDLNIWMKGNYINCGEQPYRANIYNGRNLVSILINDYKRGGRYGEFVLTKGKKVARRKVKKIKK
jgi:hypothetical protein